MPKMAACTRLAAEAGYGLEVQLNSYIYTLQHGSLRVLGFLVWYWIPLQLVF